MLSSLLCKLQAEQPRDRILPLSYFYRRFDCSFFNLLLLPAVIADIDENKKLNYHYYLALKKACFKPAAFYKGIILPVVEVRIAAVAMLHAAAFTP